MADKHNIRVIDTSSAVEGLWLFRVMDQIEQFSAHIPTAPPSALLLADTHWVLWLLKSPITIFGFLNGGISGISMGIGGGL